MSAHAKHLTTLAVLAAVNGLAWAALTTAEVGSLAGLASFGVFLLVCGPRPRA